MFIKYNPNPENRQVGDCTVRALSKALNQSWEKTYTELALQGFLMCDMPSANHVWGAYLKSKGFTRRFLPDECPECFSVSDFCKKYPNGVFILAIDGHVVCVIDGFYYDTWDSSHEIPIYYWERKDD